MPDFADIINHPDKQEIIDKILKGINPKDISSWLKLKYPNNNQKHLRLSIKIIKQFASSEYTDCYNKFKDDLQVIKIDPTLSKKEFKSSILNNKTYQERLLNIADTELDIKTMLKSLIIVCQERAEQVFDKIQENPGSFKGDYTFLRYINELFNMIEKFDKIINNAPDQIIQHNVTLQAVESNTTAILEAIRKTLERLDTQTSLLFMELFYNELTSLNAPTQPFISQEDRLNEIKLLHEKINTTPN